MESSPSPAGAEATQPSEPAAADWFNGRRVMFLLSAAMLVAFPGVMLGTKSFFYRDYGVLGYPFISYLRDSFWALEVPLWNPLSNCGAPFLAQWGTLVTYPLSLLCVIVPLPWSLNYFCLGHLLLGGGGMYLLARRWSIDSFAATLAAFAFLFNGVTFSSLIWPNYTVALGWMPWVLYTTERAWRDGRHHLITASCVAALQLLAGVPEITLLTWLLLGALALRDMFREPLLRWLILRRGLLVVITVAGLTAVQVLPFLDLLQHSQRDRGFATSKWPMPGWGWANLLVPLFHCFETPQGPFFQHNQQFMSSYYLGAAALILAIWGAWRVRESRVWILAAATLAGFILALGDEGYFFGWIKKVFPLIGVARYPVKFVVLAAFAIPLLAAYAIADLQHSHNSKVSRGLFPLALLSITALILIGVIIWFARAYPFPYDQPEITARNGFLRGLFLLLIVGAALGATRLHASAVSRNGCRLALLGLLFLDAKTHTANQNPTLPTEVYVQGLWDEANSLPAPTHGSSRAYVTPKAEGHLLHSEVTDLRLDFLGKRLALWSNLNLLERIPKINGSSTLQLREQAEIQKMIYERTNTPPLGLLAFLGASIASADGNPLEWTSRTNFLPLVTIGQKPILMPPGEILPALADPNVDLGRVVYLPSGTVLPTALTNETNGRIVKQDIAAHRIAVEVEAASPALLVVAQSYYHPWRVTIDGGRTTALRANHAFQAVVVPAGKHAVEWRYRDMRALLGLVVSSLTLLVCAVAFFRLKRAGAHPDP